MFANLVFDLDGTLVDSLPGIESSLRAALARCQPSLTLELDALRPRVGPPLARIVAGLWPSLTAGEISEMVAAYRAHYLAESCAATRGFPGVGETLAESRTAGRRLFVLTNKPSAQTGIILQTLGWWNLFAEVCCPDDPAHPFGSKEEGALSLRDRQALDPAATALVGDSADDARAAHEAGFAFVPAAYGYGGAGHGISSARRLPALGDFVGLVPLLAFHDHP